MQLSNLTPFQSKTVQKICIEIKSLRFLRWSQIVTLPPPLSYGRETGGEEG